MVRLRLRELAGLEHPDILIERILPASPFQFFYLGDNLVQDILIGHDA